MSKKISLCLGLSSLLLLSSTLGAQSPAKYIKWSGDTDKFYTAYEAWQEGQPLYPNAAEDENFFISRVKFRDRFVNRQTQAHSGINDTNEKKVINWVPIGVGDNGNANALPSGIYDSDVFSMWNNITHYGNWTAPLVRVPGAFMDAAHKNGVSTSALASVPWSANVSAGDGTHGSNLAALYNGGAEKFVKFLKQYGIDGWGINSEFNTNRTFATNLKKFMADTYAEATTKGIPQYAMAWYTLMSNDGKVGFFDGLASNNLDWFHYQGRPASNFYFGNYNWNSSQLAANETHAGNLGRDSRDVYAGMNLQGAQGKRWTLLQNYKTSIGLWGAHNMNMFFESRNEKGAVAEVQQQTYLTRTERFFGNGSQNPAKQLVVKDGLGIGVDWLENFHGLSAFVSAKSVLQWSLDDMPFYSFFNLGNGRFFNVKGEKKFSGEWYNLGMQDYLPTWRYWFANEYLGTNVAEKGLKATFTWEDAWFGGSSLQITGDNANSEFLHLFKTKFALKAGDKIRLRVKIVNGSTKLALVGSAVGQEREARTYELSKFQADLLGEWQELEIPVGSGFSDFRLAGSEMAAVALRFSASSNLTLRIGEFSIIRGDVVKPGTPTIKENFTKAYNYTYKGIDGKIVFEMAKPEGFEANQHVYNDDVKTAFFKLYSQQKGGEIKFVGATTSWAGLYFSAPFNATGEQEIRFGVSAVGLDGATEGEIAWSQWKKAGTLEITDNVTINKAVIKPDEPFEVKFEDPNHSVAKWEILKDGAVIYTTPADAKSFTHQLPDEGLYDVRVSGSFNKTFSGLIQVSATRVGAVPAIQSLTFNGNSETAKSTIKTTNLLAYTGRSADGAVSRGLNLQESPLGLSAGDMFGNDVTGQPDYTLAFWIKFTSLAKADDGIHMLNIRQPSANWPQNNWGHLWSQYMPPTDSKPGVYELTLRGKSTHMKNVYEGIDFKIGVWTHIAYTFEKTDAGRVVPRLYINGKYVPTTSWGPEHGAKTPGENTTGFSNMNDLSQNYVIMFGGEAHKRAGIGGVLDDVKFYKRALTAEQVAKQMYSTTPFEDADTSSDLAGFWDFETNANASHVFESPNTGKTIGIGRLVAAPQLGEGVTIFTPLVPAFEAGSPFINGNAFKVETKAKWDFARGQLVEDAGNKDTAGGAKVTYARTGNYTGTLTLTNSWGSASKTIQLIEITDPDSAEMTDEISLTAFPNPFVESVAVRFAAAGEYMVSLFDLSGNTVSREALVAEAGGVHQLTVNAPAGVYLMRITTMDGKLLQTIKLQKK